MTPPVMSRSTATAVFATPRLVAAGTVARAKRTTKTTT